MSLSKKAPILLLRLLAMAATVAAIIAMITAKDSTEVLNMKFEAKYTNSPTFKYFVIVNAIAAAYTLLVLFLPSKLGRLLLVLDMVMILLLDSGVSSCLAIAQVGKNGNSHAGWLPICGQVPKFCDHVKGALIACFAASVIYFLLLLYSLHKALNLLSLKA